MIVVWPLTGTGIISSPPYHLAAWPSNLISSGHWKHFTESKVALLLADHIPPPSSEVTNT